ncbi:MAG: hypothetical protein L0216_06810 [Planctomycetales bacterium]|nr:hypothetical protein [Planctomycetales bacterium]
MPPQAQRQALGLFAGAALAGILLTLSIASLAMVFGVSLAQALCPVVLISGFFLAQYAVARLLRMPIRGPSEPMGPPEDEAEDSGDG